MVEIKILWVMVKWLLIYYCYLNILLDVDKKWVLLIELFEVVKVDLVMIW